MPISFLSQLNRVHALPSQFFKIHLSYPSTCLSVPSDLFRFPAKTLYPFLLSHIVATYPAHLLLDDLNTNYDPTDYRAFTSPVTSLLLGLYVYVSTKFSVTNNPVGLVCLPYVMWSAHFFVTRIQTEKISSWNGPTVHVCCFMLVRASTKTFVSRIHIH